MKKAIAIFILMSFIIPLPVRAGVVKELDSVEKELLTPQKAIEQKMTDDFAQEMKNPSEPKKAEENKSGSNWWKWALGIVVIGGIAAAAGGGGGGGGSSNNSSSNGGATVTGSW